MFSVPVTGNEGFSVVRDVAKYIPELTVGKITTTTIDAVHVDGRMTEHTLVGYAPITEDLLAITAGRTVFLNNAPGLRVITDADMLRDQGLIIPQKSILIQGTITNNGVPITPGTVDFSVGHTAAAFPIVGVFTEVFNTTPAGTVNRGGAVADQAAASANYMATVGGIGLNTVEQFATMSVITAAVTAGDLKVTITYRLVPEGPQQQPVV